MNSKIARLAARSMEVISYVLGLAALATAQQTIGANAGVVQYAVGEVFMDGTPLQFPPGSSLQMGNGQLLSTRRGYVELLLAPQAYLRLGEDASLRMRNNELDDIQLDLNRGSAFGRDLEVDQNECDQYSCVPKRHRNKESRLVSAGLRDG